jgi:hypothetical protein
MTKPTSLFGVAFFGYGLALNRYDATPNKDVGFVISGHVEKRWSWGLGLFGDVCFKITEMNSWFCVQPGSVAPGTGNVFFQLSPGTVTFMKGFAGRVAELVVHSGDPNRKKNLVEWGYANARVRGAIRTSSWGGAFMLFGLALIPLYYLFRRYCYERFVALCSALFAVLRAALSRSLAR